jgi:protein ImuA
MLPALVPLQAKIRTIEGGGMALGTDVAKLGAALDSELLWGGLPTGALHEVGGAAGAAVTAAFASRFLTRKGSLVWCRSDRLARQQGELYGPGLRPFAIAPDRLLYVLARDDQEALWATAEALRSPAVACAVLELERLDLVQSRKLQLAAEAGRGAGILLRAGPLDHAPNAARTRFWAEPRLGSTTLPATETAGCDRPIRLSLWRAKGMAPAFWTVIWNEQTLAFDLVAGLADRADGGRRRAAG